MPDTATSNPFERDEQPRYTVFVLEDNKELNELIQRQLRREGYTTQGSSDAEQAIQILETIPKPILILDYQLGSMTAKEGLELITKHLRKLPFIIMTGYGDERLAVEMMKLGAHDYIIKDTNLVTTIPKVVRRVLRDLEKDDRLIEAELALRDSEANLKALFGSMVQPFVLLDKNAIILTFNAAAERFAKEHFNVMVQIKKSIFEYIPPAYLDRVKALFQNCFKGNLLYFERMLHLPNGISLWYEIEYLPVFDQAGIVSRIGFSLLDITPRKQSEELLRRFERVVSATPDLVSMVDRNYTYRLVNRSYLDIYRKTEDQIVGHTVAQLHGEDTFFNIIKPNLDRCLEGEIIHYQSWFTFANIDRKFYSMTYYPYYNAENSIEGVVVSGRDISELKRVQDALVESREQLTLVTDSIPLLIAHIDATDKYLYVNKAYSNFLGMSKESILAKHVWEIVGVEEFQNRAQERINVFQGQDVVFEAVIANTSSEPRTMRTSLIPQFDPDRNVKAYFSLSQDITEERRAEERFRQMQKTESLGMLAGNVAHDFNNLLQAMLAQTSVALSKLSADDSSRSHIEKAIFTTERAADLTRQLLAYSGRGTFEIKVINLSNLITENFHLLELVIPKNVRLQFQLNKSIKPIQADAGQLQQILMNLVINAAEAIDSGSGTISIQTAQHTIDTDSNEFHTAADSPLGPGEYVILEVADTGCGMDPSMVRRIFDPFFTTKFTGRGLGLAAVLGIVSTHHGGISIRSEPGKGTSFKIAFPVSEGICQPDHAPDHDAMSPTRARAVLIIDDEDFVREAVKDVLETFQTSFFLACDGYEGIELYKQHADEIDIVLLDLSMPGLNGEQTFRKLKEIDPNVRVILTSGYTEEDATKHFPGKGLAGFIQKPFSPQKLIAKLDEFLGP
jgi:PAS domain S-box-containing protein